MVSECLVKLVENLLDTRSVITSYSIHYTKLYDTRRRTHPAVLAGRITGEQVAAATLVIPQGPVEFPAVAAIVADEQAAGDSAGIQPARLAGAPKGKIPDLVDRGGRVLGFAGRRCLV